MKSKKTKRALLSSAMALLLCFSMLLGTTFAWFTDSASTGVNKIQAGNLDIEVEYTLNGTDWKRLDEATDIFQKGLWEPGHTELVGLKVHNAGNLSLKYNISLDVINEIQGTNKAGDTFKLSDYLKAAAYTFTDADDVKNTFDGTTANWDPRSFSDHIQIATDAHAVRNAVDQYFVVKVWMPETVGNEANAISTDKTPSISIGISVLATQDTVESDSYGNDYDKDADYPVYINKSGKKNGTVYKAKNETLNSYVVRHEYNGNESDGMAFYLYNGAELTINHMDFSTTVKDDSGKRNIGFYLYNGSKLTINSGNFNMDGQWNAMIWAQGGTNGERCSVTINGGNFKVTNDGGNSTIVNAYSGSGYCGSDVYITGGFFDLSEANPNVTLQWKNDSTMTVTGGTFVNYNPADHGVVPTGYKVETSAQSDGKTWYTVVPE